MRSDPAVVSITDYLRLIRPKPSFVDLIRSSSLPEVELDLRREQTLIREIEF